MDFLNRLNEAEAIGLDVPVQNEYPSFTERYFSARFKVHSALKEYEDHCILVHSNKVCIITLALTHPIIEFQKVVTKVDFEVSENTNRLKNIVRGKRKHGAQLLDPFSILCIIECQDGSRYSVRSCVHGKLIEINESLVKRPELLLEKPNSDGFIAMVLPNKFRSEKDKDDLLTQEEYVKAIEERKLKCSTSSRDCIE